MSGHRPWREIRHKKDALSLAHSPTDELLHLASGRTMPQTFCGADVVDRPQVSERKLCAACWASVQADAGPAEAGRTVEP